MDLPTAALAARTAHRRQQAAEGVRVGGPLQDGGFVFCNETGAPLDEASVCHRAWLPLRARADPPHMQLRNARHSRPSTLVQPLANSR